MLVIRFLLNVGHHYTINMKKLFIALFVSVIASLSARAQTTFSTNLSAGTSLCLAFPAHISSITVAGTSSGATTVTLFDNSAASSTYTNAAYTSALSYATNMTSIITNSAGNLQTNTFAGVFTTTTTTAANTNTFPSLAVYSAAASSVSGPFTVNLNTVRGLAVTASTNATLTVNYRRLN